MPAMEVTVWTTDCNQTKSVKKSIDTLTEENRDVDQYEHSRHSTPDSKDKRLNIDSDSDVNCTEIHGNDSAHRNSSNSSIESVSRNSGYTKENGHVSFFSSSESVSGNSSFSSSSESVSGNSSFSSRSESVSGNSSFSSRSESVSGNSIYSSRNSADPLLLPAPSCLEKLLSWRYVMVLLLHMSFVVTILERNCLPIAMVCMADPSPDGAREWDDQASLNVSDISRNQTVYEFGWPTEIQGLVLTAVSFSSFVCPLMVDFVRPLLGNKATLTLMSLLASTLTFLTPVAARRSPWLLFTVRLVIGMFFGGTVTIMGDNFAWWAPVLERQTMTALAMAGVNVGGIITSAVTGFLCLIPVDHGWPFIFYVFGALGTLWSVVWYALSSQKPETHPFISTSEETFIVTSRIAMEEIPGKRQKPPYRLILTSRPVLAFVTSVVCNNWTTNVYFTYLPAFFVTALDFTVQQAGVILSILSAIRFVGHICWTSLSNLMIHKANVEATHARKTAICVGFWLSAVSQCSIIFLEEHHTWPVVVLVGVIMFNVSVGSCVATVLPLEIAPRYSGFLNGLAHSVGGLFSITGPLIVSILTPHGTVDEWKTVWIIVTVVFFISGLIFFVCGDASLQAWGKSSGDSNPTIVSPFVAMGRRFSVVMNSSPLTPAVSQTYARSHRHLPQNSIVSLVPNGHGNAKQSDLLQ